MDKRAPPSLFVNDGSFMERFKQLQQDKEKEDVKKSSLVDSKPNTVILGPATHKPSIVKASGGSKTSDTHRTTPTFGGKLAFSLKQKSKLVTPPVKLGGDEDEDEMDPGDISGDVTAKRQKLGQSELSEQSSRQVDVAAPFPSDPTVKNVADKLASFVAKNGRQFEHVTRQKNPGDTPFKFLFNESCADYKYYEYRLAEEEKALSQTEDSRIPHGAEMSSSAPKATNGSQWSLQQKSNYQIPASALYEMQESKASVTSGESSAPPSTDPIAMMEFYVKKAAQEERKRRPKQSNDEMPPPPSLQAPGKKGHHMGDYIPLEELEKFMAACDDVAAQKAAKATAERSKIQADNVGHKLLSKMGWKEGEGLGGSRKGIADPIMAGNAKKDNLGVGAQNPGDVNPEDDIYEQYKKRMMLGYRHRPNPMNNP